VVCIQLFKGFRRIRFECLTKILPHFLDILQIKKNKEIVILHQNFDVRVGGYHLIFIRIFEMHVNFRRSR